MEIKDYLRALGKRAWIVILVPVLAAALALGYQLGQPASYQSSVTVLSHPASAAAGSVIQYITSFQAAMNSDTVINQVAQQAHISPSTVRGGLSSAPSGVNSIILKVSYTTKSKSRAPQIAQLAAQDTLLILARPSLTVAQATLAVDQAQYTAAKAAVDNFITQANLNGGNPLEVYRQELAVLGNLQVQQDVLQLEGNPAAAGIQKLLDQARPTVDALAADVASWQRLQEVELRNATAVADAQRLVSESQAQLSVVTDPTAVAPGDTTKLSVLPDIIKIVGPVGVVALVLVIGVIILLETMRARRRNDVGDDSTIDGASTSQSQTHEERQVVRSATGGYSGG